MKHVSLALDWSPEVRDTHHLIVANDCHDTQRLNPVVLRVESRIWPAAIVVVGGIAKDNIGNVVGIQIANVVALNVGILLDQALERRRGLGVGRVAATTISFVGLIAVAVDVHVGEEGVIAMNVDCS